jgi:glycosyltransferase involved in cell wall biosynthesis
MVEYLPWDSTYLRVGSHEYGSRFAADGHEILWISSFWHVLSLLSQGAPQSVSRRIGYLVGRLVRFEKNVSQYSPFTLLPPRNLPILSHPSVLKNTLKMTIPCFKRWIKTHGWDKPDVLWLTNVYFAGMMDFVQPLIVAHRMADDVLAFNQVPPSASFAEKEILRRADVVYATSRRLVEKVRAVSGKSCVYLPNGVSLERFVNRCYNEPLDLAEIPHPRVLYVGIVDQRFDAQLLKSVAKLLPDVNFIIIGPHALNLQLLYGMPNVHIFGPRSHADIPAYMQYSDVGIVPFVKTPLTDSVNPIKIYQYLAAGLPAVCTNLEEAMSINPPVSFASGAEEFARAIRNEIHLGKNRPEFCQFAKANDWDARYKVVVEELAKRIT